MTAESPAVPAPGQVVVAAEGRGPRAGDGQRGPDAPGKAGRDHGGGRRGGRCGRPLDQGDRLAAVVGPRPGVPAAGRPAGQRGVGGAGRGGRGGRGTEPGQHGPAAGHDLPRDDFTGGLLAAEFWPAVAVLAFFPCGPVDGTGGVEVEGVGAGLGAAAVSPDS